MNILLVKVVLVKSCDSAPPPLPASFEIGIFKVGLVHAILYFTPSAMAWRPCLRFRLQDMYSPYKPITFELLTKDFLIAQFIRWF